MSVELLAQIAGALLALGLAYIPGAAEWYGAKDSKAKARIVAGLLVVVGLGVFGLACGGIAADLGLAIVCDRASAVQLVRILFAALMANQTAYLVAVHPFKARAKPAATSVP
jgi:hypothetical protein